MYFKYLGTYLRHVVDVFLHKWWSKYIFFGVWMCIKPNFWERLMIKWYMNIGVRGSDNSYWPKIQWMFVLPGLYIKVRKKYSHDEANRNILVVPIEILKKTWCTHLGMHSYSKQKLITLIFTSTLKLCFWSDGSRSNER